MIAGGWWKYQEACICLDLITYFENISIFFAVHTLPKWKTFTDEPALEV